MSMLIKEACIGCGECEAACPTHAIAPDGKGRYFVDFEKCEQWACFNEECGCVEVCPVEGGIVFDLPFEEPATEREHYWAALCA